MRFPGDHGDRVAAASAMNQLGPMPAIIGELGWTGRLLGGLYPQGVRLTTRDFLWLAALSGSPGAIGWDGTTTAPGEFRMFAKILGDARFAGLRKRRSPRAVAVGDPRAECDNVTRFEHAFSRLGVDYDVIEANAHAPGQTWLASEFVEPEADAIIACSSGYRAKVWVGQDGSVLAYVRNDGGTDGYGNRVCRPAECKLDLHLPTRATVKVFDLDGQTVVAERGRGKVHKIRLGETTHDFVVWARP